MRVTPPTPPHKGRAIAYEDGFPSPRRGEGRVRGASIEKRPERAAALTFPLLRNGPPPLPIGERNSDELPYAIALENWALRLDKSGLACACRALNRAICE